MAMAMISHKPSYYFVSMLRAVFFAPLAWGDVVWKDCYSSSNYTANSTYQSNLRQLWATLPANASSSPALFATAAAGTIPDTAYALALCRGDAGAAACGACVANAFRDAQQLCAYSKDATVYYEPCRLRFSDQNFLASVANTKQNAIPNMEDAASPAAFDAAAGALLDAVVGYAAARSPTRFATGRQDFADRSNPSIYALAQCTPDMTPADCRSCLEAIVREMPKQFGGHLGGRIMGLRCNYRYEIYSFFSGDPLVRLQAPASAMPPSATANGGGTRNKSSIALSVALAIVSSALGFTFACFCVWSRRKQQRLPPLPYSSNSENIQSADLFIFGLSTLEIATENFSERNKLGEGGFGVVYKGALPDGHEIAVKRLSQGSNQGLGELKNELILVAKLRHKNLVRLVGVCLEKQEKLVIYEYMSNRSLDTIIFDHEKRKDINWEKRLKIINGIARGLQYVHEDSQLKIIHRDLKASNVLLDSDLNPKISDFGLARLFEGNQSKDVTNRVVGTFGYMAPEYVVYGHYSIKSDVFSFGVMVLEIITGRRSSGSYNSEEFVDLSTLVWEHWVRGTVLEIVDPFLGSFPEDEVLTCVHIGLQCVQESPAERPAMSMVNAILGSNTVSLKAPSRPAFCVRTAATISDSEPCPGASSAGAAREPGAMSPNGVSLTELVPR